ncbi:unnamed protein product [Musa acuminata subsp. malaccensis]|uniref:(wild Malaysian banana) hypothetical protein n=1 Tax=Musa acuminata subsp. malaccensis TaxID=214687 RepID=A0A8D7ACH2_MUSAM|nr:unnamed protein product [Musa acuminata subsp. malaccensis]
MEAKANAAGTPLPPSKVSSSRNHNPGLSPSPSPTRLWRPAAQRNIRNQWSKLLSNKDRWASAASEGRSQATSLVNAYLNQRYMPAMELGVLKDMPGIRQKACDKLARKQETYRKLLLSSYNDMVLAVAELVKSARSMRCFLKGPIASPLAQFSDIPEHENDPGDGGGIPVFSSFSITYFENLAHELVKMFLSELSLKRFLVVELLSIKHEEGKGQFDRLKWSDELYSGEFQDLTISGLCSEKNVEPLLPSLRGQQPCASLTTQVDHPLSSDVLQVYLTTWLADVNIDTNRFGKLKLISFPVIYKCLFY